MSASSIVYHRNSVSSSPGLDYSPDSELSSSGSERSTSSPSAPLTLLSKYEESFVALLESNKEASEIRTEAFFEFKTYLEEFSPLMPDATVLYENNGPIPFLYRTEGSDQGAMIYLMTKKLSENLINNTVVYKGIDLTGKVIVFKSISKPKISFGLIQSIAELKEADKHFFTGHSFQMLEVDREPIGQIFPYLYNKDLYTWFGFHYAKPHKKMSNKMIYPLSLQMAQGVEYLHRHGLVHCDIKLENFFVAGFDGNLPQVRLGDFEYAHERGAKIPTGFGTPGAIDPADFSKPPRNETSADPSRDIWALGCAFAMLKVNGTFQQFTAQKDWNFDKLADMSQKSYNYYFSAMFPNAKNEDSFEYPIRLCLQLKPDKRITSGELTTEIQRLIAARSRDSR